METRPQALEVSDCQVEDAWELWEKTGVCRWWRTCVSQWQEFPWRTCCYEFAAGCYLCVCILAVPVAGVGVPAAKYVHYMMPSWAECLRCGSEAPPLWSMSQGYDTKCTAACASLAWLGDVHCNSMLRCRGCTWLEVCLSQQEVYMARLVF